MFRGLIRKEEESSTVKVLFVGYEIFFLFLRGERVVFWFLVSELSLCYDIKMSS